MRIAVVGSGGVGGYFGGRLAAGGASVGFLARGAHLAALRDRGLRIVSPAGDLHLAPVTATDDPAAIGRVDVVLFAVKLYDTEGALPLLPALVGPHTMVVPLQNGVEAVEVLTEAVGREHVAGGTCYLAAVVAEPGVIRHTAMGRIIFGPLGESGQPVLEALRDECRGAGVDAVLSPRIMVDIWAKFIRLSVLSGMTAVTRCPIGPILTHPDLRAMAAAALRESAAVARARGIAVAPDLLEEIEHANAALPPATKSSMLEDLERGRPLELPYLSGAVVRLGEALGVDTPTHRFIATVLGPHVNGARR